MHSTMRVRAISAVATFFEGRARSLTIPCEDGLRQILPRHENMIAAVYTGIMKIVDGNGEEHKIFISDGVCQVARDRVTILVATSERPEDIDVARAQHALELAREHLNSKQSIQEYKLSQAAVARALSRLKVSREYRN